jgi:hypothetical protein
VGCRTVCRIIKERRRRATGRTGRVEKGSCVTVYLCMLCVSTLFDIIVALLDSLREY